MGSPFSALKVWASTVLSLAGLFFIKEVDFSELTLSRASVGDTLLASKVPGRTNPMARSHLSLLDILIVS